MAQHKHLRLDKFEPLEVTDNKDPELATFPFYIHIFFCNFHAQNMEITQENSGSRDVNTWRRKSLGMMRSKHSHGTEMQLDLSQFQWFIFNIHLYKLST